MFDLRGSVVIVTGGAGRLGRAFCSSIAAQGGLPVVADVDAAAALATAQAIRSVGHCAEGFALDITSRDSIDRLLDVLNARYSRIDAIVNNAYPRTENYGRLLEWVEYDDFCSNLNMHLGGYFLCSQRYALYAREHGGGHIVNISSIYGEIAPRFDIYENTTMTMPVEYAAIKSGVISLTRYFAQYYKKQGIRCNAIAPGGIRDAQSASFQAAYDSKCGKSGLLGPNDIAGTLNFLLSSDARCITGQVVTVDDGFSL